MMNGSNIERTIAQVERWIIALDEQRDLAAREASTFGLTPELQRWMTSMEKERTLALTVLASLSAMRHEPCLIIQDRPERAQRQLKVPLHPRQRRLKEA